MALAPTRCAGRLSSSTETRSSASTAAAAAERRRGDRRLAPDGDAGHDRLPRAPGVVDLGRQERLLTPFRLTVAQALNNARITLEAGFTSVRDAAGTPRGVKMAIDQGLFPGPRVRIAVSAMSQTGGHGDSTMPNGANIARPVRAAGHGRGRRRGRAAAAREVLRAGADQIKVHTSGGVMSPNDEPGATGFSPRRDRRDRVRGARRGQDGHGPRSGDPGHQERGAGRDRARSSTASTWTRKSIDEMKQRGTFLVPTLVAPLWVIRRAETDPASVPPYALRKASEVIGDHQASFRWRSSGREDRHGHRYGRRPHGSNAEELERMVEGGMTPMQAIVATTKIAAECARLASITGTLEVGKRADLLGVDGDPLADIAVLQKKDRLALIVRDGKAFKNLLARSSVVV